MPDFGAAQLLQTITEKMSKVQGLMQAFLVRGVAALFCKSGGYVIMRPAGRVRLPRIKRKGVVLWLV